jgi:dihydrolipoamide dehydrogenase
MPESDVVVVGGGTGGYTAAIRASQLGAKVTLIEKDTLGGTCLNRGCIPTKALLRGAELVNLAHQGKDYGVNAGEVTIDFPQMMARKEQIVRTLVTGVQSLMRGNGIEVIKGVATVISPRQVQVESSGEKRTIEAGKIILAPGSIAATLPIPGVDEPGVITSNEALQLSEIPQSMVVVGGGAIGVEFATIFAGLGSTITIVEMLPEIIPTEDHELCLFLQDSLQRKGTEVLTGARVARIEDEPGGGKLATVSTEAGEREIKAQLVLIAVGRKPNTEHLGLEETGVKTEGGRIIVNRQMETSVPGIYAVGDAIGGILLAHVASAEGEVAAENALGRTSSIDYRVVPRCIYTMPEIAAVGMTEREAREEGIDITVGRFPFTANGKAIILGEREGLVKVVADSGSGEVLGIHIVGPHATDLIAEAALSMKMEGTIQEVFSTIHAHPTLSEAIREAALDVEGTAFHIPPRKSRASS